MVNPPHLPAAGEPSWTGGKQQAETLLAPRLLSPGCPRGDTLTTAMVEPLRLYDLW